MNLSGDVGDLISVDHFRAVWLFHLPSSPTLFLFFPPAPLLSHFLSLWASKLAWQPCTAAPTAVRRSTADPALYQPDWSHLASLLPPLCCPVGSRERGVRVRPTQGHGTGCKALAKSNMALIVFAGWSPLVCFCLPCPRGFSSRLGHKFPHTHMRLFLRSDTHSVLGWLGGGLPIWWK